MQYGKEYFDYQKARGLDYNCKGDWHKQYVAFIEGLFSCLKGKKSLDFGCATGTVASAFVDVGIPMVGLDVSAEYARLSTHGNVKIDSYDGVTIPYAENEFDFIHSMQSLEHIKRDELPGICKQLAKILKKDGIVYLNVPNVEFDPACAGGDDTHYSCLKHEEWQKLFEEAGFIDVTKEFLGKFNADGAFCKQYPSWRQFVLLKNNSMSLDPVVEPELPEVVAPIVEAPKCEVPVAPETKSGSTSNKSRKNRR